MRVTREKLIFLALSVLTKWALKARHQPVRPDITVRLALAFLFTCGQSKERRIYDEFWQRLSDPGHVGGTQNDYIRGTYCDSCIKGIITDVGAPHTPNFWSALGEAARKESEDRPSR